MNAVLSRALRIGAGLPLAAAACVAADGLVVVHDAGGTVDAAPWLERAALSDEARERALERARSRLAETGPPQAPGLSPVNAGPLRAGRPSRIGIRGLSRPVFAVGSDPASLAWLASNAAGLRGRGAQGLLVSAPTAQAAERARIAAARLGLALDPVPGAAVAEAYGARSYPFVAEPSP